MTQATLEATPTTLEALNRINEELSLDAIRGKLADREEGKGYSRAHLARMEQEYRRYLALRLAFPDEDVVPCKLVDEMWHAHILDTLAYHEDCDRIFGRYLHHFPYFGMRGERDAQDLLDAYDATLERYRVAFGEPPLDTWISQQSSRCRTACKPQKCR